MKKILKLKNAFILILVASITISCLNDDDNGIPRPEENIVQLAQANTNLSSLVAALEAADGDLPTILQGNGPFTVLAPTNEAFATFLDGQELSDIPTDVLEQVLLNHVITGEIRSANLISSLSGYASTNASGPIDQTRISIYFDTDSSEITFNGQSDVIQEDITASNGTIHIVDAVIEIPDVVDIVTTNPNFGDLVTALTTATPDTDFVTVLRESGLYTVFAPTDAAFDTLFAGNSDWDTVDDIDETLLTAVLGHHVIGGTNILASSITDGLESPATLEGDTLSFNIFGSSIGIVDGAGNTDANIQVANIQGSNGVIHVITRVLIPDTTN
ncbi:MAG: fasciclin domain-containing protein [Saonia sp.]